MERDPVCGMELNNILDVPRSAYNGGMIYFCCPKCKEMFDNDPETYISGIHYRQDTNKLNPYKCDCDNISLIYSHSRR